MTDPLPHRWADALIDHAANCRTCIGSKVANVPNTCTYGRELIRRALKERHG